jgi:SAM-dependent methyltransferase
MKTPDSMSQPSSFDNFDEFAKDYRQIHNENIKLTGADSHYFSEFKVKWLRKYYGAAEPAAILDLGAGDGTCLEYFSRYFPKSDLFGIDVSELSIEEAAAKNLPRTQVQAYDGSRIPYGDKQFDLILVATVMHHIRFDLHEGLMKEALRVLKPGGKIFIVEHNPWNPVTRHMVNTCPFDEDAVLLSPPYSKKLLRSVGFRNVKNHFTLFYPRGGVFKALHFTEDFLSFIPLGGQYVSVGEAPGGN